MNKSGIVVISKDVLDHIEEVRCMSYGTPSKEVYIIKTDKPVPLDDDTAKYAIGLWLNKDIEPHAD
jgi:hypothetical protein